MKRKSYRLLMLTGLFALFIISCKKEFNPDFELPRQFNSGDINVNAGETQAVLTWRASLFTAGKNETYTVEVNTDSLFGGTPVYTTVVDTPMVVVTDSVLEINQRYFARVKANAMGNTSESGWVNTDNSFRITGEQIFSPVLSTELTDSSVVLRWRPSGGLTKIVVTPTAGGTPLEVQLTPADTAAHMKTVKGLSQLTAYTATIYKNNTLKGKVSFTTPEKSIFTTIISPGDDLVTTVENAANGDVIGLQPGTYNAFSSTGEFTNLNITGKTITIQSVSGKPSDTKVNFKEIDIKGTGAGVTLSGIEFDGTAGGADYFLNLVGLNSSSDPATFTNIVVDNSIVHHTNNAFLRGNRASANDHKVDTIRVNNTIAYDNGNGTYHYFMIDKLEFKDLEITNSTFYNFARALISWASSITVPVTPRIWINHSTFNNWGFSGRDYILLDANKNDVNFTMQNSILANTPKPNETVGGTLIRAGSGSTLVFQNNDYFNLNTGGSSSVALTFPSGVQMANNQTIDLGWTATTTDFTLPQGSPLRTASTTNGPIGDPRWAF